MSDSTLLCASVLAALILVRGAGAQILIGQHDPFAASTENWTTGGGSPSPPTWISSGGPAGGGDGYLKATSLGGAGAGSRMAVFNRVQWSGNFLPGGVAAISLDLNNLGATPLNLRFGFAETGGTAFVSTTPFTLAPGSGWVHAVLPIEESDLIRVSGAKTYSQTLGSVLELRLLSAGSPQFSGDAIAAVLGIDNVTAVPEPSTVVLATATALGCLSPWLRRRQGGRPTAD